MRAGSPRPGAAVTEATAELVTGPELDQIRRSVIAKYGLAAKISKAVFSAIRTLKRQRIPYADRGVIITLP